MIQASHSATALGLLAVLLPPLLLLELAVYGIVFVALALLVSLSNQEEEPASKAEQSKAAELLQRLRRSNATEKVLREVLTPDLQGLLRDHMDPVAGELAEEVSALLAKASPKVARGLCASFGQSGLFLSGGGMLGMYHVGTVRRLLQEGLLPQQICGTSVGSIIGAFAATRTDEEMRRDLYGLEEWFRQMGPVAGPFPVQYWEVVVRVLWRGYIYDYMNQYRNQATFVSMGLTFAEAYARTGRTLTITCASSTGGPVVLLNRHTAPNVMIASAICASSSMPMLVEAVRLLEKAPDGSLQPWEGATDLMRDGTMMADSPCRELEEMLNVRWSLVSQVNPHVVPLLLPRILAERASQLPGVFARSLTNLERWTRRSIWATLHAFQNWTGLPRQGCWISQLLFQDYFGDVNVVHSEMRFVDYLRLIKNETTFQDFRAKVDASDTHTKMAVPALRLRAKLEAALRKAVDAAPREPLRRATGRRTRV
ncbi:unnamed protein product [Effrenium voratum]|uniref:PNPLA domain-containing protein n=1 Tax=Effrenium voratum TaxID=2562239 RepID=A0AA36JSU1_9DINO|nr:unnamed protein product [Effrenium voratum]